MISLDGRGIEWGFFNFRFDKRGFSFVFVFAENQREM